MRALALCLLLTACAQPTIVSEPKEVRVPVPVPCKVKPAAVPEWATDKAPATCAGLAVTEAAACHFERVKAMGEELAQRIAYEIELRGAIDACAGKQP